MGSVVFPEASLKVYLAASVEARAKRRYNQLMDKGLPANMESLLQDLEARDSRDRSRPVAPLQQGVDALLLDTTALTVDEAVEQVLRWVKVQRA